MQYPVDYATSVITISSVLIALAGILIVLRVNQKAMRGMISQFLLYSIFPGIGAMVFSQYWFSVPLDAKLMISILFLALQLVLVMIALFAVVYSRSKDDIK